MSVQGPLARNAEDGELALDFAALLSHVFGGFQHLPVARCSLGIRGSGEYLDRVAGSDCAGAAVDQVLTEEDAPIRPPIAGQGGQWLFPAFTCCLIGGGNHTAGAGLDHVKVDVANTDASPLVFLVGCAA
jgi:hypothetical protein